MFIPPPSDNTTEQLSTEVKKLSLEQQKILLMHLRKNEIYARARAYDKANKPPKITTAELIEIIKDVRKKRHR
jgi:hypothetical protein